MRCCDGYNLLSLRAHFGQSLVGRDILVSSKAFDMPSQRWFLLFGVSMWSSLQEQVPLEAAGCPCNT